MQHNHLNHPAVGITFIVMATSNGLFVIDVGNYKFPSLNHNVVLALKYTYLIIVIFLLGLEGSIGYLLHYCSVYLFLSTTVLICFCPTQTS